MKIKLNTWTGTYTVYRDGNSVPELRKTVTKKMREVMDSTEYDISGQYKIWEEVKHDKGKKS